MEYLTQGINELLGRGGWVAYPLLFLSMLSVVLIFERVIFWVRANNPWELSVINQTTQLIRTGKREEALRKVNTSKSVYGVMIRHLLQQGSTEAMATEAIENQRSAMERFMPMLGTLITAAPMMGILGTVSGIISAFKILSEKDAVTDPSLIGSGIAEALLTTVAGLVIALVVLFPFNAFKAQIDRTLGRMESIAAILIDQEDKK